MSNASNQTIAWVAAFGISGAMFGGGGFLRIKLSSRRHDNHIGQEKHDGYHGSTHTAPHWSYSAEGTDGPEHWGSLSELFAACESGTSQSPVDIGHSVQAGHSPALAFHYRKVPVTLENNGHTIVASSSDGENHITVDGEKYTLAQFHFHNPSEHMIKGHAYEMELHLVHKNATGHLAVIGVMLNEDGHKSNADLLPVWSTFSGDRSKNNHNAPVIDLAKLLPKSREYFHYAGSLTTPPCTEGVRWFVLKNAVGISTAQVQQYAKIFGGPTNRPVQPLNEREVVNGGSRTPLAH